MKVFSIFLLCSTNKW